MIRITLNNAGCELDSRSARTAERAAEKAIEMIRSCGQLYPGDRIEITGDEESIR
jgi:hypothetical protein